MSRLGPRLAALAIAATWTALLALLGPADGVLAVAPLLGLLVPLLWGSYPGEAALQRGRSRFAGDVIISWSRPRTRPLPPRVVVPRGASLIAFSLSGRGPPRRAPS
jgi:hypothetical protein